MDVELSWQTFACTGDILCYLCLLYTSIELDSVEIAAAVFGNCDRNIRMLEKEFSVTAVCRGTMLRISGEPANVAAAARAVEGMLLLIEDVYKRQACCPVSCSMGSRRAVSCSFSHSNCARTLPAAG